MKYYRIFYINAKGETAGFTTFMALNDTLACKHALSIMAKCKWPGAEVWESGAEVWRPVHCAGVARSGMDLPNSAQVLRMSA
jgi:hypothetical protein